MSFHPLEVHTSPNTGRTYHATAHLPAESIILSADTPYTYTIWKQFRNEVCAECWRYDCGRRGFLTRRDAEGFDDSGSSADQTKVEVKGKERDSQSAGLWFCDERCQASWIAREGRISIELLRRLEEGRRKTQKGLRESAKQMSTHENALTRDTIDRAWTTVQAEESSVKTLRKWATMQLDAFETDMARYVLLAVFHLYREERRCSPSSQGELQAQGLMSSSDAENRRLSNGGATWSDYAALQKNEFSHLAAYPELLENQIRVYQVLKGRFGSRLQQSKQTCRKPIDSTSDNHAGTAVQVKIAQEDDEHGSSETRSGLESREDTELADLLGGGLEKVITVDHIRTAFSIDPGNSFGIWETPLTEESECLGFAVYPKPSFFNHHCAPNVTKVRKGRALKFVTTRAVAIGEELCISYGHVGGMNWAERQKELRDGWFFDCRCSRCEAEMSQTQCP